MRSHDAEDARKHVAYWAEQGATSFKAYMQITRDELGAAIEEAHRRGIKITGHLCSVTYAEAAELGIDNLEHGFLAATDFVADKQPDVCPARARAADDRRARRERRAVQGAREEAGGQARRADLDADGVRDLYAAAADAARARRADAAAEATASSAPTSASSQNPAGGCTRRCFPKAMRLERAFAEAGGLLVAGTDPTGSGGVVPGYSNQRQIELLVEAGFSPLEAIKIGTLNGAKYLGRDARIGTSRSASRPIWSSSPAIRRRPIADIRRVETVFKNGVGYDPGKLIASVRGQVGVW